MNNNNDDNKGDIDMLLPRRNYNLFDEFFDNDFWGKGFSKFEAPSMKTDVKDVDGNYELSIELPGFNKEDITASLKNGYLTVSAKHEENNDKKDENDKYIRRERRFGSCERSFFVGEAITEEDIKASYNNGILKLTLPKEKESLPQPPKTIAIE